jgi:hypothetical protein
LPERIHFDAKRPRICRTASGPRVPPPNTSHPRGAESTREGRTGGERLPFGRRRLRRSSCARRIHRGRWRGSRLLPRAGLAERVEVKRETMRPHLGPLSERAEPSNEPTEPSGSSRLAPTNTLHCARQRAIVNPLPQLDTIFGQHESEEYADSITKCDLRGSRFSMNALEQRFTHRDSQRFIFFSLPPEREVLWGLARPYDWALAGCGRRWGSIRSRLRVRKRVIRRRLFMVLGWIMRV